jgi:nucleoside-diphosphate-sugar epimerase
MSKRVIITGATGFVGANLVRRLLRDNHEIHALVRPLRPDWRIVDLANRIHRYAVDVTDRGQVRDLVHAVRPHWVFHLAAYGAYSQQKDAEQIVHTNIIGSMVLLEACADAGVESFIQAGSSSEYGWKNHAPSEEERIEPNSVYAISKAAATHYGQLLARQRNINAITLRLYSIFGPYEEPTRLIPTLLIHGLRSGLPKLVSPGTARDFVYIDDAVDALVHVASMEGVAPGAVYNVCTGTQTDLSTAVACVQELLPIREDPEWGTMPPRFWDTHVWVGDPSRMSRETGWKATTSFRQGLELTIRWFRNYPEQLAFYEEQLFRGTESA